MKASHLSWALLPFLTLAPGGAGSARPRRAETGNVAGAVLSDLVPYRGVSLAGAEFAVDPEGKGKLPGTFGTDYIYPHPGYAPGYQSVSYYVSKGMTTFRLPFRWERLQPARHQPFDAAELARLTTTVNDLLAKGATVVLDPHNYARYGTWVIGSSAVPISDFADFWGRLATLFRSNPRVIFGLMNEPHDMPTEQWVGAANAAIAAIRAAGANNLILVPGNGWDGAETWSQSWYGTPNAMAMLSIHDPGKNHAFEVHQYLDRGNNGAGATCPSATIGSQRLADFTGWLRVHGEKGFLGEFSAPFDKTCYAALDDMLKFIEKNQGVWLGWTYWAGGPWWGKSSLEPSNAADKPQMRVLLPHLG
jgi:endoglucanase